MSETPLVSILMPTYNGAAYIARAIESVMAQTYQSWELIIVDDGSTDTTAETITQFLSDERIKYLKNENNLGIQKTLNRGLKEALGKYIARIDDDDRWIELQKLALQVQFLQDNSDHVLVGTGVIIVDEESKELIRYLLPQTDANIRKNILGKNCFVHSSVMFKKDAAFKVGGYDESKQALHMEDYDLWFKIGTIGKFANLPLHAIMFTLREGGLSSRNKITQAKKAFTLAKKYKDKYPGYYFSVIRSTIRLVVYGFILQFPIKVFVNRLAKWYKENW
ncbi:MAG: hypothetical protein JWL92_434 [Candidatus Nomurabacteria bacterium]|nr:hypothetical protein [Candidatus Nomurabacteria bacterium]